MAEVLGTVASIIAVVQVAGQTAVLGYGYISGVKRAPEDIRKFLDELESLSKVLTALGDIVKENPDSVALKQLDASLQECLSEMSGLQAKMEPKEWWRKKLARYKWPLRGKETAEYTARIERHKSSFSLALNTEQLSRTKIIETDMQGLKAGQKEEKRRNILHWFSPGAFDKKHVEISGTRQQNTGEWLLRRPEVRDWVKKNPNSPILWGYGIPGAGKTYLSSRVIDHLLDEAPTSHYGVAYVYFDYKERDQQQPVKVLASLVKQLVLQIDEIPAEIEALYDKLERQQKRPKLTDIYAMLLVVIKSFSQTFIICDALDECDQDDQRRELLPLFHRMGNDGINLFLTSRRHPEDIQDSLQGSAQVELSAQAEDITSYVEQKINDNPRARRLFGQGNLKDRLISELTGHTKGMFLLVRFHTEYLCQQTTVREILRELEKLNSSLNEERPLDPVYNRAMETLRDQHKNLVARALKILSWLVKARRTLTVRELQQAVSVEQGQTELDDLDLLDKKTILDVCASLVTIDEKSDTVRLAHYTVQEYILKNSIIPEDADFKIVTTCTTFLTFDVFSQGACTSDSSLIARFDRYPLLNYAAMELSFHLRGCDEALSTAMILKFLDNSGCISSFTQATEVPRDPFIRGRWNLFPKNHLALHVAASLGHCSAVRVLLERGADIMAKNDVRETALHRAATRGHEAVVRLLIEKGADISAADESGRTALHGASIYGYDSLVHLLIKKGADISAVDRRGWTALQGATLNGHESVFRLLLSKGVDIASPDNRKRTMLHWAAQEGDRSITELLLEQGADITAKDERGLTALHFAAYGNGGHEPVVELLLEKGADMSAVDKEGLTALHGAVSRGKKSMVRLLLEKGADISAVDKVGLTALHKAAANGYESIALLLLEKGAKTSAVDGRRWTPLHTAAANGYESVITVLLENGADISAMDRLGQTALHAAACREHSSAVQLLLEKGADILSTDNGGRTALHWAALEGDELLVEILLEKGANISAINELGHTPLHGAAAGGHESVVLSLLGKGSSISATAFDGLTALHCATQGGHEAVVQLLLRKGADISAADRLGWTALSKAAIEGYESIVFLLLENGADISAANVHGQTALHAATYRGHELVARLLVEQGADVSAADSQGRTPLHWAVQGGNELLVKLLLQKGADPSAKDCNGIVAIPNRKHGELVIR